MNPTATGTVLVVSGKSSIDEPRRVHRSTNGGKTFQTVAEDSKLKTVCELEGGPLVAGGSGDLIAVSWDDAEQVSQSTNTPRAPRCRGESSTSASGMETLWSSPGTFRTWSRFQWALSVQSRAQRSIHQRKEATIDLVVNSVEILNAQGSPFVIVGAQGVMFMYEDPHGLFHVADSLEVFLNVLVVLEAAQRGRVPVADAEDLVYEQIYGDEDGELPYFFQDILKDLSQ